MWHKLNQLPKAFLEIERDENLLWILLGSGTAGCFFCFFPPHGVLHGSAPHPGGMIHITSNLPSACSLSPSRLSPASCMMFLVDSLSSIIKSSRPSSWPHECELSPFMKYEMIPNVHDTAFPGGCGGGSYTESFLLETLQARQIGPPWS